MQGRPDEDATPLSAPETDADAPEGTSVSDTDAPHTPPVPAATAAPGEPRADTAVSPVIRGASVSIPTPAWGTALAVDDTEVVVAELVDDDTASATPSPAQRPTQTTATGGIPIPEPAVDRRPVLGALAVVAAIATIVLHSIAVNLAAARDLDAATGLAWAAIIVSFVAIALGVLAAVFRSGRWTGLVAAVVALFANPWVLLQVLTFFSA